MKIGLLITARLKSTRLPYKLLLDLNGRSIIERVIDRAKKVNDIDQIVLCTSLNQQDKPLTDIALKNEIHYYLGSEEDVIQRLLDAGLFFGLDYILSITGENPLFSIEYANQTVNLIKKNRADLTLFEGLPTGCTVYGVKLIALKVVCQIKKEIDTEFWGPLINRPELFTIIKEKVLEFYQRPGLRLTSDYIEDYQFLTILYSHYSKDDIPSLFSVLSLIDRRPEYLEINKHKKQARLSDEHLTRIETFFSKNFEQLKKIKNNIYKTER